MKLFAVLSSIITVLSAEKAPSSDIPKLIQQEILLQQNQNQRQLLQNDFLTFDEWRKTCSSDAFVKGSCSSCVNKCYTGNDGNIWYSSLYKCDNGNLYEYDFKKASRPASCSSDQLGNQGFGPHLMEENSDCCKPNGIEVVKDKIYAVNGKFNGGLNSAEAKALCSNGFEICPSAKRAQELGLTADMCNNGNFLANDKQFFATLQSSNGNWVCNTDINSVSKNDIWGCSKNSENSGIQNNADCGVLTSAIASFSNFNGWTFTDEFDEINTASTDGLSGGVLCCTTSI